MHRFTRVSKNHDISLFDYDLLPACARSCRILEISEGNCVPPAAPISDLSTYRNCVCQSDYLRSLHTGGVVCQHVCNEEDDEIIHSYYVNICTSPKPAKTNMFISTLTMSSAAVRTTVASSLGIPKSDYQCKYLATAAGVILAIIAALLGIVYYRRRNNHNSKLANQQVHGRSIALQSPTCQAAQSLRLDAEQDRHLKTSANADSLLLAIHSPSVPPPFAPPTPSHKLGHTIRVYAKRDNEGDDLGRSDVEGPTTLVRSLSRTERLIRERIRMTGRPDIPISATPKITR
ncbi:hypothetical protein CC77DRAFT_590263 [Alternaria alternata]|uniref:Uncharacterized protein n=1 Tax=Alternaria alternata TaxID=5599 RepID=A0A177D4J0_ALTAL|nr:hypothetical protein CC77DRAFT_590263 [Alternaria alternata]OAG13879.1 hypothetical protein CC77DRAFT_590263 [Alternaria alternata]